MAPNPLPGQQYVVDGSGAVVQTPYNVPPVSINSKGLFDCYYVEWTDILGCAKEIGNNIASALTNGSASLTTGSKTTINGTLQEIGNSTGSLNMEAVTADDAQTNVADYMIRRTWNQAVAGDNVYSEWNNYILYGALILAVVGVMGVIVMSNHSSKK